MRAPKNTTMTENNELNETAQVNETPNQEQPKKAFCKHCGAEIEPGSAFCPACGKPTGKSPIQQPDQQAQQPQQQFNNTNQTSTTTTVIVENKGSHSNGLGTAGFVLSLIAFFVCWIPVIDFVVWFLGALFSFIGIFKKPRGLAIAGLVISFIGIIILLAFFGAIIGLASR